MKRKYLLFVALMAILVSSMTGCYVERGDHHPYYPHHHYHHEYGRY